jgi:hypothetical protein
MKYAMSSPRAHVAGERQAAEQKQGAEGVDDVIDVVAVPRPLLLTYPRERAVEAVTEPVQGQAHDRQQQADGRPARHPEGQAGAEHGHERKRRQVVGIDEGGHARRQPEQRAFLQWREDAREDSGGIPVGSFLGGGRYMSGKHGEPPY